MNQGIGTLNLFHVICGVVKETVNDLNGSRKVNVLNGPANEKSGIFASILIVLYPNNNCQNSKICENKVQNNTAQVHLDYNMQKRP